MNYFGGCDDDAENRVDEYKDNLQPSQRVTSDICEVAEHRSRAQSISVTSTCSAADSDRRRHANNPFDVTFDSYRTPKVNVDADVDPQSSDERSIIV